MSRLRIAIVLAATLALVLSGTAIAHKKFFTTTLIARYDSTTGTFSGEIHSTKAKCEQGRTVVITAGGNELGRGKSDASGAFEFSNTGPAPHGTVEAEATQRRIKPKNRRHKHVCLHGVTHVTVH